MLGLELEADPYDVIETLFEAFPIIYKEQAVDIQLLYNAIQFLIQNHVDEGNISLKVELLDELGVEVDSWDENLWDGARFVPEISIESISPSKRNLKLLLIAIIDPIQGFIVGHYVLVKRVNKQKLEVIEPNDPQGEMAYTTLPGTINGTLETLHLFPEPENVFYEYYPAGTQFVVVSVLSVRTM